MFTFALKGNKEKQVNAAYSSTPLEIKGTFNIQGPQIVGDDEGCAPNWVYEMFKANPNLQSISLNLTHSGVVFYPIK